MVPFRSVLTSTAAALLLTTPTSAARIALRAVASSTTGVPPSTTSAAASDVYVEVENDYNQTIVVQVWDWSGDWKSWTWATHPGGVPPVGGGVPTTYKPGDRFDLGASTAWGSWYILQAFIAAPGGCNGTTDYYTADSVLNNVGSVFHFGEDCLFHSE
ncbi:hypothetical protein FRB94_010546 [Tulasnella sp. JGI-2019a]|nr:hypothetical protein FRB94_010546 [Tulasnella sp. JGI-2019a]KAG9017902.1 hypothetical protein FRB93_004713 [Tulasnella sp. JGI-2019a]KAG9039075.1 hypothetical protein FRB95_012786 [Tulasnella sp. JGI-2019a]